MAKGAISDTEAGFYEVNGYVLVRGMLDADEMPRGSRPVKDTSATVLKTTVSWEI